MGKQTMYFCEYQSPCGLTRRFKEQKASKKWLSLHNNRCELCKGCKIISDSVSITTRNSQTFDEINRTYIDDLSVEELYVAFTTVEK
jgi:TPP-dependent indolepyruvate ferredoxin oxidoreductase alpha subunit